jgi:hypothetical protein
MSQLIRVNGRLVRIEPVVQQQELSETYEDPRTMQYPEDFYPAPVMPRPIRLRRSLRSGRRRTPFISAGTIAFGVFVAGWIAVGLTHPGIGLAIWGLGVTYLVHCLNRKGL